MATEIAAIIVGLGITFFFGILIGVILVVTLMDKIEENHQRDLDDFNKRMKRKNR